MKICDNGLQHKVKTETGKVVRSMTYMTLQGQNLPIIFLAVFKETCCLLFLGNLVVFKSYQDNETRVMKGSVQ